MQSLKRIKVDVEELKSLHSCHWWSGSLPHEDNINDYWNYQLHKLLASVDNSLTMAYAFFLCLIMIKISLKTNKKKTSVSVYFMPYHDLRKFKQMQNIENTQNSSNSIMHLKNYRNIIWKNTKM